MTKAAERAAQLKARMTQEPAARTAAVVPSDDRAARAHFVGATVLEQFTHGRTVQALPVRQIAPELRDDLRQPRLLPLPEELRPDGVWDATQRDLVEELLALGRSLRERQIQPIVVYPTTSASSSGAPYLIAAGHRRWTAAVLVELPTIDAIVIDPPSAVELLDLQYTENEDRADFSDMERAWALARMKRVLQDAPWNVVEQRFRLREGRRKQLMRLLAFTPPQQQLLARIRASETHLRPLHVALRDGTLTPEQADHILAQMSTRSASQVVAQEDASDMGASASGRMDGRTVGQLVTRIQRSAHVALPVPRPRWLDPLKAAMGQARKGLLRLPERVGDLDAESALELHHDMNLLLAAMRSALETLQQHTEPTPE